MHKSRKQSDSSARKILIKMVLSSDHLTAATSKTVTVNISKNGGSFGAAGGSVAELSGGFYHYTPSSTDLNTLGELVLVASATDCDNYEDKYVVVPYDVFDCIDGNTTKFGGTAGTFASGRPEVNTTHVGGTSQTAGDIFAKISPSTFPAGTLSTLDDAGVRTAVGLASANLDTQLSAIDDYIDTEIAAIKAKTDNLPPDPADASDIATAFSTLASHVTTATSGLASQTSVDDLPTNSELTTALSGLATTTQLNTVEGKVDVIDGIVDTLNTDLYTAYIEFVDDNTAVADEYSVRWRKNGVNVTSGITTPLIQVIKFDGTDLVASTAMSQIGTTGAYKYTESTNRIATGQNYEIKCTATIDGSARTFSRIISRDS